MEAHARGDERAQCAVQQTATYIGMATAQLGAVVDPSVIVLGGSMFANAGIAFVVVPTPPTNCPNVGTGVVVSP